VGRKEGEVFEKRIQKRGVEKQPPFPHLLSFGGGILGYAVEGEREREGRGKKREKRKSAF
jgi:hypothetical protein